MAQRPFVDTHVHYWDLKNPELRYVWLEPDWIHPILGNIDALKVLLLLGRPVHRRDPLPQRHQGRPRPGGDRHRRSGQGDRLAAGAG